MGSSLIHTHSQLLRFSWLAAVFCLAPWLLCAPVEAATAPLVLVTANYPPYTVSENGQTSGLAVALVKAAFARMRCEIQIVVVPFPRAIEMLRTGQADGIFPFAMQQDRKLYARYPSERLFSDPGAMYVRADSTLSFSGDYAKLAGHTFGMQRGTFQGEAFAQAVQIHQLKVDEALDQLQNLRKLLAGRFDIAVGPRLLVLDAARRINEAHNIKLLYSGLSEGDAYLAFALQGKHEALIAQFEQTLRDMRQDGSYRRIFAEPIAPR